MKKKIIIEGEKIHNVGYRLHLLNKADELLIPEIGAWNIHEGGKEALKVLVGGGEEKVKGFLRFVRESSPEEAKVEGTPTVEDYEGDVPSLESFSRSLSTSQLAKIADAGVGMLKKQDLTIEKIDSGNKLLGEKIDNVSSKVDGVGEKIHSGNKLLGEKIDNVGGSVNALRDETGKDFNRMDVKYDKMSDKMDKIDNTLQGLTEAILKLAQKNA